MSELPVYLDNAATTPVDPRVAARMAQALSSDAEFGNPASSTHSYGDQAATSIEAARMQVAISVGADPDEVIWTSGATEANNLAIFGVARTATSCRQVGCSMTETNLGYIRETIEHAA